MTKEIRTMVFVILHGVIKPDPLKIQMLKNAAIPTNRKQLRGFLGLLQFYRDMLPHLAYTAHKLYAATSDKFEFKWTDELNKAFFLQLNQCLEKISCRLYLMVTRM